MFFVHFFKRRYLLFEITTSKVVKCKWKVICCHWTSKMIVYSQWQSRLIWPVGWDENCTANCIEFLLWVFLEIFSSFVLRMMYVDRISVQQMHKNLTLGNQCRSIFKKCPWSHTVAKNPGTMERSLYCATVVALWADCNRDYSAKGELNKTKKTIVTNHDTNLIDRVGKCIYIYAASLFVTFWQCNGKRTLNNEQRISNLVQISALFIVIRCRHFLRSGILNSN